MNRIILAASLAVGALAASAVWAEQYVDYTPVKGVWQVTTIRVDPNHIDDYLVGLRKGWVPSMEILKKHGIIDQYIILQKLNSAAGDNIQLIQHFVSGAVMDPDKNRDVAIQKEMEAQMSKAASAKMTGGFDKYRTFVSDDMWTEVKMVK
ncbi:MAG TPA: hypothetical protein VGI20_04465 [Rhizomicrobium sp.]